MLTLCRITNFDLFFSFMEIMLWLHIVLGVTITQVIICLCTLVLATSREKREKEAARENLWLLVM